VVLLQSQIEGKYEILEKIKEGGMGAVYKVRHRFLDEIRVVKVIRSSLEPTAELSDRFLREARMAIRLRHPNMAALHDFAIADGGSAYIVMEYIEGLTLEDILRAHGPPPLGLTLEIAQQSLKAIGYLHRRGFVHRDIAPDNLMLTRGIDGEPLVKLIDLGIAKVLEGGGDFTSTGMFLGKPRYASPEHFGAEGGLDGRSDLYSFGVVLYELATGHAPVVGHDPASFMAGHLMRPPREFAETDPAGRVPPELRELLLSALAKRSDERIASADELARRLAPLLARCPVEEGALEDSLRPPEQSAPAGAPAGADDGSTQSRLDRQFGNVTTPPPELRGPTLAAMPLGTGDPLGRTVPLPRAGEPDDWRTHSLRPATPAARADTGTNLAPVDQQRWLSSGPVAGGALSAGPDSLRADGERGAWIKLAAGLAVLVAALGGGAWWYLQGAESAGAPQAEPQESNPAARARAAAPMLGPAPAEETAERKDGRAAPAASSPAPGTPGAPAAPGSRAAAASSLVSGNRGGSGVPVAAGSRAAAPSKVAPAAAEPASPPGTGPASPPGTGLASPPSTGPGSPSASSPGSAPPAADRQADRSGLIEAGPGVEAAEPTSLPDAVYPPAARGSGLQPHVLVAVLVDEKGNISEARIKSGDSSSLGFNEAALAAVKRARFLPATRNGVAGRSWSELMIEFTAPPAPAATAAPAAPPPI
jgi:TonB family protein